MTNGTRALPWSIPYSVTNTNPYLKPGDTVLFKDGGTYSCTESNGPNTLAEVLEFRKSGTPGAKITYRPESLWGFSFDGGLLLTASNLVVQYCRVFYSGSTNRLRSNFWSFPPGISDMSPGNELLHNLVENTGHPGIASWKGTRGKYIAGNIIRFPGFNDWTEDPYFHFVWNGARRGSGMYLQNLDNSSEALVEGNISYFVYTEGAHAYGQTDLFDFRFRHNIYFGCPLEGIFYDQDNYPTAGVKVETNFLWAGVGIYLGYTTGPGNNSNGVVVGNYSVSLTGPALVQVDGWWNSVYSNNTAIRLDQRYMFQLEVLGETNGNTASHAIDFNTYYSTNYGRIGSGPFLLKDISLSFDNWKAQIHGDTNSTFTYGLPATNSVSVFRPSTDSNFVHVAVFNWLSNTSTTVDLSSYFATGSRLAIYDAQNIPTAFTNLTYTGGNVVLPLTLTNRATMLGTFTNLAAWSGFDPRFRAFVIYRDTVTASPLLPPTALRVAN